MVEWRSGFDFVMGPWRMIPHENEAIGCGGFSSFCITGLDDSAAR
jgi:hypothetical protein